jgi:hypothetical protein
MVDEVEKGTRVAINDMSDEEVKGGVCLYTADLAIDHRGHLVESKTAISRRVATDPLLSVIQKTFLI